MCTPSKPIEDHVHRMAEAIGRLAGTFIFKASFDKANRSSVASYGGPGLREDLRILASVRLPYSVCNPQWHIDCESKRP
jgi:3-deoxy-D-manno-octulosonic acid (KDO) 8-phosphate synthase